MKVAKSVIQLHRCTTLSNLMEEFKHMVNEAIRIGIEKKITSKLTLRNELYPRFKNGFHTSYISMAVFRAHALLKNYRKHLKKNPDTKRPYVKKPFLVVDSYYYKIIHNHIQIPTRPREFVVVPLNQYVAHVILKDGLELGNAILTPNTLVISYSKVLEPVKLDGFIAIDRNLDNITCYNTDGNVTTYDISKITKMKETYSRVKSHFIRNDVRIRKKIFEKYGRKQRNKEDQLLHKISKELVCQNKGMILEDLRKMRKLYRKGNGQGTKFRRRLNSWSFYKLGELIRYKLLWNYGIPVIEVNPRGTSTRCSICDAKVIEENRVIACPQCGNKSDRDVNAAKNILFRGMRFVPAAVQNETVKQLQDVELIVPSLVVGDNYNV